MIVLSSTSLCSSAAPPVCFLQTQTTVCRTDYGVKAVCADDSNIVLFHPQDLHLHKFFQHCQLMRTTTEGSPAELIKYLKVIELSHGINEKEEFIM